MSTATKRRELQTIPLHLDAHPDWVGHQQRLGAAVEALNEATSSAGVLEAQRQDMVGRLSEIRIAAAMDGDPTADERTAEGRRQLADLDQEIAALQDTLAVQREAVRRLESRSSEVRREASEKIAAQVDAVAVAEFERLDEKLSELQPIADRLLELLDTHANFSPVLSNNECFSLIRQFRRSDPYSLVTRWLRAARDVGADVRP